MIFGSYIRIALIDYLFTNDVFSFSWSENTDEKGCA